MNAATANFTPTAAILVALKAAIAAAQLPNTFNPGGNAFANVQIFDMANLVEAFRYVMVEQQRVCVIVPLDAEWIPVSKHPELIRRRVFPVALLISDRVLGNRQTALIGDNTTPGASGLKDVVLPLVTGQLISNSENTIGVVSEPTHESVLLIKDTKNELPNRITYVVDLECRGGTLQATLDPGPTL